MNQEKTYNLIISGVGGQGVITLLQILAQAAMNKGYKVRTSELHGLSQRGGSVSVHIRFGREVHSPTVPEGKADLILALEYQESLASAKFASDKTVFLINEYQTPTLGDSASKNKVKSNLEKISKEVFFIPASVVCEKNLKTNVVSGIFLLGYASKKGYIPFDINELKEVIKQIMPEKYCGLNINTLDFADKYKHEKK